MKEHNKLKKIVNSIMSNVSRTNRKMTVELISLHVPKTAGTSFKATLQDVYGRSLAFAYDKKTPNNLHRYKAIHGHLPVAKYANLFPDAKVIMWMRDPIERIISYYNYWKITPRHGNPNHDFFLDNEFSLIEFARLSFIKNELFGYYLNDFDVSRFYFIGIVERYETDINVLANLMGWKNIKIYKHNVVNRSTTIDTKEKLELEELYKEEIGLYKTVLSGGSTSLRSRSTPIP